jgi:hypothetical protein
MVLSASVPILIASRVDAGKSGKFAPCHDRRQDTHVTRTVPLMLAAWISMLG